MVDGREKKSDTAEIHTHGRAVRAGWLAGLSLDRACKSAACVDWQAKDFSEISEIPEISWLAGLAGLARLAVLAVVAGPQWSPVRWPTERYSEKI